MKGYRVTNKTQPYDFDSGEIWGVSFKSELSLANRMYAFSLKVSARATYRLDNKVYDLERARRSANDFWAVGDVESAVRLEIIKDAIIIHDHCADPFSALQHRSEQQLNYKDTPATEVAHLHAYLAALPNIRLLATYAGKIDTPQLRIVKVNLPAKDKFLVLDAAIGDQPKPVLDALIKMGYNPKAKTRGWNVYHDIYRHQMTVPRRERLDNLDPNTVNDLFKEKVRDHRTHNPKNVATSPRLMNTPNGTQISYHKFICRHDEPYADRQRKTSEYFYEKGIVGAIQNERIFVFSEDSLQAAGVITSDFDDAPAGKSIDPPGLNND